MQESFASVEFREPLSLPDPFLNFIKESGTVENGFLGIPLHFRGAEKKELKKKKRDFSRVLVWLCLGEQSKDIENCQDLNGFIQTSWEQKGFSVDGWHLRHNPRFLGNNFIQE